MNITLATHFFPPRYNAGTENYTLGVAEALTRRGHDVSVLCADGWSSGARYWNGVTEDTYRGIRVFRIALNWTRAWNPNRVLYDSRPVQGWLERFLSAGRPDLVHVTSAATLGVGVLRAAHRHHIPLVLTLMDFWFLCPRTVLTRGNGALCDGRTTPWDCQQCLLASSALFNRLRGWMPAPVEEAVWSAASSVAGVARWRGLRGMALNMAHRQREMMRALRLPRLLLSHSRFVRDMFSKASLSTRIRYLPNGHDLSWVGERKRERTGTLRVGYIGQIIETKGVHILVDAFRRASLGGSARLDIWGDLTRDPLCSQHVRAAVAGAEGIRLCGGYHRDALAEVLSAIDVIVVPSLWYENAPLVIQEAFAARIPVIATNLGGMAEAVTDEVNGLLFRRGDVEDLARQLRRVAGDPALLSRLESGIPRVKTIDEEVGQLETIYQYLCDRDRAVEELDDLSWHQMTMAATGS